MNLQKLKALFDQIALEVHRRRNAHVFYATCRQGQRAPGIIEICGIRGIGKSTLFQSLIASDSYRKINIYQNYSWAERKTIQREFLLRHQEFSAFYLDQYRNRVTPSRMVDIRIRRTFQALDLLSFIEASKISGLFLKDENLCQRGLSLAVSGASSDAVKRYFDLMPKPAGVLLVTGSEDLALERQQKRDGKIWTNDYAPSLLALEQLTRVLERLEIPHLILEIDRQSAPEEQTGRIMAFVKNITNPSA